MLNRWNHGILYSILCCLSLMQTTLQIYFDDECVQSYSASYKRQAHQSSDDQDQFAKRAVDGDKTTCSKTLRASNESRPWWQVDLDKKVNITYVQVTNSERHPTAIQVYIRYDIDSSGMACGYYHVLAGGETRIIRCKPTYGRSVKIVGKMTEDYLSLCEVQIFDDKVRLTEGVMYQVWFNTSDISYQFINTMENSNNIKATFEAPRDISNYYGVRMKTYYNAPESGSYIFNMTGDNKCTLFIRDAGSPTAEVIGRIPLRDDNGASHWTRYEAWNESEVTPYTLTKGVVYELTALMIEKDKRDHLRVGVTFPNGTFVGPINSRIFINENAARTLTKNYCAPQKAITFSPSLYEKVFLIHGITNPVPQTTPTNFINTENAISNAAAQLLSVGRDTKTKFELLDELERLGFEKAKTLNLGERPFASYALQIKRFAFAAVALNLDLEFDFNFPRDVENFTILPEHDSFTFPAKAFPLGSGRASAVFMMFQPLEEMVEKTGSKQNHISSNILSASMERKIVNVTKPFTLIFRNNKVSISGKKHCVFWIDDVKCKKDAKFGRWSDKGCSLVRQNVTHTTCACNHLTKFSVLFPVTEGSQDDEIKLELITYVGLSLSSVGCLVTFVAYLVLRITRTLKTIVHLNLVLALGLADLIFLFGNLAENDRNLCFASTMLSFYLYLAAFAWMLVEGIHLYFLVIRVFGSDDHRRKRYYHIIGWGTPLIVVTMAAVIFRYDMMSEKHCWLSAKTASIWVFIGPSLFVILINAFILTAVLRTTMTLLRNDPGHRKEKSAMRTLAMLVPILGTTWIFGVVAFTNELIIFQYIFATCNAFQGFFIFILYCLFNTEVRHEYQRKRNAWKTERELDSKRSPQNNSFDL